MKKRVFIYVMMVMALMVSTINTEANKIPLKKTRTTSGETYVGTIGNKKVTFYTGRLAVMNAKGEQDVFYAYSYEYDDIGKEIDLEYCGERGKYEIFKEYVNGKCTGTFKLIWTAYTITGTFRNYKGQTFKVFARNIYLLQDSEEIRRFL